MGIDFKFELNIGEKQLKPKEVAKILNVTVKTLQRWDKEGILIALRTPTDRRYYTESQIKEFKQPEINDTVDVIKAIQKRYAILEATDRFDSQNIEPHVFIDIFLKQMGYDFDIEDKYFISYASRDFYHTDLKVVNNKKNENILFVTFKSNVDDNFIQETKDFVSKINCSSYIIVSKRRWIIFIGNDPYELDFSKEIDFELFSKLHFKNINLTVN